MPLDLSRRGWFRFLPQINFIIAFIIHDLVPAVQVFTIE